MQAKNPECGDYREMVLSFEISEGRVTDYRWWLTLNPGAAADFRLETGDSMKSWRYDAPADLERDVALCDAVAGKGTGDGHFIAGKRAFIEITMVDGDSGRAAVNDETVAGFEDLVLDELPADLLQAIKSDLATWQAQQSSGGSTQQSGAETAVETTGGAHAPEDRCSTHPANGSMTFANGENDPATFYEWELLFDAEQGSMTMFVGPPDARQTKTVDFALTDGGGAKLCEIASLAASGGEPTGTAGPAGTVSVTIDHPDSTGPVTAAVADPVALQDQVLVVVPAESWGELWQFYSDWTVSQGGG